MTTTDYSTMVGIFDDLAKADQAVEALRSAGFTEDAISVIERNLSAEDATVVEVERASLPTDPAPGPGVASTDTSLTPTDTGVTAEAPDDNAPILPVRKRNPSRYIVTVRAPGREQEAVGIMHEHGANNSNLPPSLEYVAQAVTSPGGLENVTNADQAVDLHTNEAPVQSSISPGGPILPTEQVHQETVLPPGAAGSPIILPPGTVSNDNVMPPDTGAGDNIMPPDTTIGDEIMPPDL
ncbi:MAG TPA: hypothetical protein VKR42_10370 [Ktedonobacteraceae bacterium]|nr:hypothetical protein [Ktedonobacteraceae bacterium]